MSDDVDDPAPAPADKGTMTEEKWNGLGVTWRDISRRLSDIYTRERGEWCGIPTPVEGFPLEVEPNNPHRETLQDLDNIWDKPSAPPPQALSGNEELGGHEEEDEKGWTVVNSWRGRNRHGVCGEIFIARHSDGRTRSRMIPDLIDRFDLFTNSFAALDVWNVETELAAQARLRALLNERQFASYILTGAFVEASPRSKLAYFFRRLRPTLVLSLRAATRSYHPIAALCLHPIAYYRGTPCGAMVPTDDVIAHLMMMRADEPMFWRRANQHNPWRPEGGL
jgi:hypothetical protein